MDIMLLQLQMQDAVRNRQINLSSDSIFPVIIIAHNTSVDCTEDAHCTDGQSCQSNKCSCSQDADCAGTQSCQNGLCEELSCDSVTCGSNAHCLIASNTASCVCDTKFYAVTSPDAGCGKFKVHTCNTMEWFNSKTKIVSFQLLALRTPTALVEHAPTTNASQLVHKILIAQTQSHVKMAYVKLCFVKM